MSYSLLIYEEVPENTRLFIIPNEKITDEQQAVLEACHNKFVNQDDQTEEMDVLAELICKEKKHCRKGATHACQWAGYEHSNDQPLKYTVTRIFISGFIL